ncbi:uncharacterized protein ARMOST_20318 [Armillaria ostoyae]|uniref:Uncharacterized protein n=1 Tax=Armillaria ostoyae TaxID=47428 RepID=A0A284S710_ARMOS|nr:uncharacterized protein ARMOST_20318 [Armillaria ostoyae]
MGARNDRYWGGRTAATRYLWALSFIRATMKYIYLSYKMFGYCLVKEMALVKTPKLSLGRSGWYGSLEDELWRVWANGEMASHLVILSLYVLGLVLIDEAAARSPGSGYPSTKTRCQNENELVQSVSCHVVCYCRYTANMDEAWHALGTEQRSFDEEGLEGAYDEEQHYGVEREDISPVLYSFGFKEVLQSIDSRRNLGRVGRQKIQHYRDISMDKRN